MRFDLTFNYFPLGTLLMPAEPWSTNNVNKYTCVLVKEAF